MSAQNHFTDIPVVDLANARGTSDGFERLCNARRVAR